MRMRLPLAGFPGTARFSRAYIDEFGRVAPWFAYNPFESSALAARLAELDARPWPVLSVTAALAGAQQELWGGDALAVEAALALAQPGTTMVVTGQQPGLLGGPLYTPFKAITAVLTARRLAGQFPGRRFVPVFWIASADSDFEEVSRSSLLGAPQELHELRLTSGRGNDGQMLHYRAVDEQHWASLLSDVAAALPGGLYHDELLAALGSAYPPADRSLPGGLVRGFARWLMALFRGTGLVVIDPEELLARADIGALYAAQLRNAAQAEAALEERGTAITAAGFDLQVALQPGDTQLFHVDEQGYRDKLLRAPDGMLTGKHSGRRWPAEELARLAEAEPARFSGSALFRPLAENALFPCAAWVGGQAELAYRAQSTALFELHGMRQAPAFLRHHATLLTTGAAQALAAAGLEFGAVARDPHEWARQVAQLTAPAEVQTALRAYRQAAEQADDNLLTAAEQHLPELQRSLRTMRGKLAWHLARVERKVLSALNRRGAERSRALLDMQALAYPSGKPQERVLNLLSFLPRTGFGLIPRLLEELAAPCWEHCLIMLD
jgi:bacillithiol biosynthesis cysteine-adding enzyme BshC